MSTHFSGPTTCVTNPVTTPVIEIINGFFSITTDNPVTMALTGADMGATLNRVPLAPWQSFVLMPGKVLETEQYDRQREYTVILR